MFKEEVIINDDTDGKVEAGAAPYQAEFHNLKSGIYKKVFIEKLSSFSNFEEGVIMSD